MKFRGVGITICSVLIMLLTATGLSVWIQDKEFMIVRERLAICIPIALMTASVLFGVTLAMSWLRIKLLLSNIQRSAWVAAFACAVLALVLGAFVAPRTTRILFDEQIYQQIGQTIAHTGKAYVTAEGDAEYGELVVHGWEYNKQPMGYPFLLSLLYRIFGVHEFLCWLLNNVAFAFSTLLIFFIARLLFEDDIVAVFASLVYAMIPMNAVWANTGAAEPTTVLAALLAVGCGLVAVKAKSWSSLIMAASACAFASQFRMESMLILVVVGLVILSGDRDAFSWGKLVFAACLLVLLLLPHLNHLYIVRGENWGSDSGQKFLLSALRENAKVNGLFFVENKKWPIILTLLVGVGLISKMKWKWRIILIIWFMLMWGVFLPFYAGSYKYGADIRFSLMAYPPLAILTGVGVRRVVAILTSKYSFRVALGGCLVGLIVVGIYFFPVTRTEGNEGWDARLDWKYAKEFAGMVPPGSAILTHDPNMFLIWGKNAAQMSMVSSNPDYFANHFFKRYGGNVFLHWDYWCNADMSNVVSEATYIIEKYETEIVAERQSRHAWYRLYRIKGVKMGREAMPVIKAKSAVASIGEDVLVRKAKEKNERED